MKYRILALTALVLASLAVAGVLAESQVPVAKQVYVKKATWSGTMIATRANCAELLKGAKESQLNTTAMPKVWAQIEKDWPAQCARFRRDLPGQRYLDWFLHSSDVSFEQWIMGLAFPRLGSMAPSVRQEFEQLKREKAAPNDPRWLDLYGRACRVEDVAAVATRIWLSEARKVIDDRIAELNRTRTAPEDAGWVALQRQATQWTDNGPVTHAGSVSDLRAAVATLANRLAGGKTMLKQLDEAEPRWNATIAAAVKQDAKAMAQVPALYREVREFRRSLLRSVRGMPEFLDAWSRAGLEQEWENQFAVLLHDLGKRGAFEKVAGETLRPEALILASDRDPADIVLRRTAALHANLKLAAFHAPLAELQKANAVIAPENVEARYVLFAEACRLRRQIAFANPLLSFDKLLFIKRHLAIYQHMCDQFYGIAARPGGALCVLENPFSPNARVRDLLANSVVERGRLKGQKLSGGPNRAWNIRYDGMGKLSGDETEGGSFLSPDVSFDGKQIAFAYVECHGRPRAPDAHRSEPRTLGGGTQLPRLQSQRRRLATRADYRRHVERFRSLLHAQRTDRLHQRTARRLSALWPDLPDVHRARHGGGRE